jgi:group I intron endonuclease
MHEKFISNKSVKNRTPTIEENSVVGVFFICRTDMSYSVYKHTSPHGKVYIGITSMLPRRRWQYGWGYQQNTHFFSAIKKYGWENFSHEILFSSLTKEEAEAKEIELIAKFDSTNPQKGYNLDLGGSSPGRMSEVTRKKISESTKGENSANYGKHHSEEAKRKMSIAAKKRPPMSDETRRKIGDAARGEKHWSYGKSFGEEHRKRLGQSHCKPIECVETKTIYRSTVDAELQTGINNGNISSCCTGKRKTAGGFTWRYAT